MDDGDSDKSRLGWVWEGGWRGAASWFGAKVAIYHATTDAVWRLTEQSCISARFGLPSGFPAPYAADQSINAGRANARPTTAERGKSAGNSMAGDVECWQRFRAQGARV
jgi:hypothetical protein